MALFRRKHVLILVGIILLPVGLCLLSLATIDSDFVTHTISRRIEKSSEAKTTIHKAEIRPFAGEVTLRDVKIDKQDTHTAFEFVAGNVKARVSVKKLIFRQLDFVSVHIEDPTVTIVRTNREIPRDSEMAAITDLLAGQIRKLNGAQPSGQKEKKTSQTPFDFVIHDLAIKNGRFSYKESRGGRETTMGLEKLNYHATDVSISRFYRLLVGANIDGDLVVGNVKGSFKKVHTRASSSVSVTHLDMKSLGMCFLPTDAFVIDSGTMSASAEMMSGGTVVRVEVSDFKIAVNPDQPTKKILFLDAKDIAKYVNRKGGRFNLKLTLSGSGWHTSEDLDELIAGFLQELFTNLMSEKFSNLADWLRKH